MSNDRILSSNLDLKALKSRLEAISGSLLCRDGVGHYCPNCDNTTFDAAMSLAVLADQLPSETPASNDAVDAAKWRALRNCARITAIGGAGLRHPEDSICHVTLNFWTHNEREKEKYPREWLDIFVEKAQRLTQLQQETNPRITLMNDGRAMGGSDVCHTCEAHCTVINDLQTALDFVLRERITLHDGAFFQRAEVNHPNPSCGWYSFPSMPDGVSATLHEARDRLPAKAGGSES